MTVFLKYVRFNPLSETLGDKMFSNFVSMDRTLTCDHST